MQRLLQPSILTLSLAVPTASLALGLGDIRVESALHQPLVAQIELIGAADDEISRLSASIASDELFQHYNLERAPFIYGTTLSVGRDAQGRPVLNMRSTEKFTEPVVTLLVDLHTPHGELVREYTLFLDPPGLVDSGGVLSNSRAASNTSTVFPAGAASSIGTVVPATATSNTGVASSVDAPSTEGTPSGASVPTGTDRAASVAKAKRTEPSASASAAPKTPRSASPKALGQTYTVSRRDTLDHIVTATGARSRIERHRMMIAIFRNNPAAFQNNFNRMHAGVTLTFPTAEQLAAISVEETNREYDTQMAAWHGHPAKAVDGDRQAGSAAVRAAAASVAANAGMGPGKAADPAKAAAPAKAATDGANAEVLPTDPAALKRRIASLEQSLAQVQQQLQQPLPAPASAPATPITALAHHIASDSAATSAPGSDATAPTSGATVPASTTPRSTVAAAVRTALRDANASSAPAFAASPASAAAPGSNAAALATTSQTNTDATDEAASEDDAGEAPAPKRHLLELISAAIGAAALLLAGAWLFLRRRNSYKHASPKYSTATAEPISSHDEAAESNDLVDFAAATASVAQLPAKANEPFTANAPTKSYETPSEPKAAKKDSEQRANKDPKNESSWFEDSFSTPIADLLNDPTITLPVDETAILPVDPAEPTLKLPANAADQATHQTAETEVLVAPDLQFADTNTEHVVMGSALNETRPVERRKNPVDVLRQAIEREPDRSDLRLKLLELYYTAAAENRRAFLEASRQLSKSENLATAEDWSRIADMGRIIAPDDELFSSDSDVDDKRVA